MTQPALPQPASTVVMLRSDQKTGFEVYLNRRPDHMDTYAGVYVFPGGRVEESDCSAAMLDLTRGITAAQAREKLGADLPLKLCLGFWVAAVRELFEEVGVHLFLGQTNSADPSRELVERIAKKRPMLQRGEIDFAGLLTAERVYCDLSRLIYFFHRVTPEHYPTRFDTRFYLAALPPDQVPLAVSEEVSESLWVSPRVALERFEKGEFPIMPPTVMVLRILNKHDSWAGLRAAFNLF
jgi:8-oxo-dGTP pyrophosphatase MutT (NUDIX family)